MTNYERRIQKETALSMERLRTELSYDPETGIFRWLISRGKAKAGAIAGHIQSNRSRDIKIDGRVYSAHRLAFLWMTGAFPKLFVDHINQNPDDNRWSNLREATHAQNLRNIRWTRTNTSGYRGVRKSHDSAGKWCAQIKANGRHRHLGTFTTPEAAHAAYLQAASELFGEFAPLSGRSLTGVNSANGGNDGK